MPKVECLTEELQKVAVDELGEVPSRIDSDLEILKKWIEQQPHLRARTDDQFLIQFLRGCKYSLERAKEKIDLFFTLKTKYPNMFAPIDVDEKKFRDLHDFGCYTVLPKPLNDTGPRLVVGQFNYNVGDCLIEELYYPVSAMFELALLHDPYAGIQGIIFILDFGKSTTTHLLQFTPSFCKKVVSFLEKSMPLRIRSVYFINVSTAAQQVFKIILPLCSEKLRQRIHILGSDLSEMKKDIPLKYLPKDYGGDNGLCKDLTREYHKTYDQYREYFKENSKFGTDENLRLGKSLNVDELSGAVGSFRKLAVD
ncbi:alpha-tocopherol transfer protein-like [Haematobia irritans]|uniref:alpha-tocopherol transfer protein-like n=1 Tax=Haematobia irritans TaxID=7368 RepID=UPI003F5050DA